MSELIILLILKQKKMKRIERWFYSSRFACKNACRTTVRANRMYALSLSCYNKERKKEK